MTIAVAAGGSGGHLYPAISVIQELKKRNPSQDILLITDKRGWELATEVQNIARLHCISALPFLGAKSVFSLAFWTSFAKSLAQSMRILQESKPQCIIGFGGFVSFYPLISGKWLRRKTAIHEQNAQLGLANQVLSRWVDHVYYSMPNPDYSSRIKFQQTGLPIRLEFESKTQEEAREELKWPLHKKILLVVGGSQGSKVINQTVLNMATQYKKVLQKEWFIVHVFGRQHFETMPWQAHVDPEFYQPVSYTSQMPLFLMATDVVLTRGGSSTLHEISYLSKPSIIVPYPYARAHQVHNARVMEKNHAAKVILEPLFDENSLKSILCDIQSQKIDLQAMSQASESALQIKGREVLADHIEHWMGKGQQNARV